MSETGASSNVWMDVDVYWVHLHCGGGAEKALLKLEPLLGTWEYTKPIQPERVTLLIYMLFFSCLPYCLLFFIKKLK